MKIKTTIEISDNILLRSKRLALQRHVTLRSLVEEGLMKVVDQISSQKPDVLNPVTFRGDGVSPEFEDANWQQIRHAIYEER